MAFTIVYASSLKDWYFDSGCFKECNVGHVTFGDGFKGEVLGKENISQSGLPILKDVRLVKGLSANLISINQSCDQGFNVNFLKGRCLVTDSYKTLIMTDARSYDNCYLWTPMFLNLVAKSLSSMSLCPLLKNAKMPYSN